MEADATQLESKETGTEMSAQTAADPQIAAINNLGMGKTVENLVGKRPSLQIGAIGITKSNHEQSKKARKIAANSRKKNRRK
jgi:hypothetical protein